jgi:hypothetical protein
MKMPHIFFERLERRRSTQALLGNISTNGLSGFSPETALTYSMFGHSAPYSMSGSYGFPLGTRGPWDGVIFEPSKLSIWKSSTQQSWLNQSYKSPSMNYLNNWTSPIQQPWLTPSPWPSTQFSPSNWTSPLNQEYPVGLSLPGGGLGLPGIGFGGGLGPIYFGSYDYGGGLGIRPYGPAAYCCYAFGGMGGFGGMSGVGGGMSTFGGGISKLEKVRKNLLAFFQNKGILNDKQRQRLLSSPFDKA